MFRFPIRPHHIGPVCPKPEAGVIYCIMTNVWTGIGGIYDLMEQKTRTLTPPMHCTLSPQLSIRYLLHVAQYILSAVKHSVPFLGVELINKVCCVVFIAVFIP